MVIVFGELKSPFYWALMASSASCSHPGFGAETFLELQMGSSQAPGATGWLQGARAALGFGVMHEQTQPGVLLRAAGQSCSPGMSEVSQTTLFMTFIK